MQRGEHGQMKRACTALSSWSSESKVGLTAGEERRERRKAECRKRGRAEKDARKEGRIEGREGGRKLRRVSN